MKKSLTLALALLASAILTSFGVAQERREIEVDSSLRLAQPRTPSLPCCECLGGVTTLNLNTGQSSPIDPIWSVNTNSAFTTPPVVPQWISLNPAQWIQPVASPTPSWNVPAGVYKYTVRFNIPKCTIPGVIRLNGNFSADNSATAFLDNPGHQVGSCAGPTCYTGPVPLTVNSSSWLTPGLHTLEIDVKNNELASGLIVNATLTRQCQKYP